MLAGWFIALIVLAVMGSGALLLMLLLVAAVTGRRRGNCDAGGCRSRGPRWWPFVLAMPLIFILYFVSNIRIEKTVGPTNAQAHVAAVEHRISAQQEQVGHRMAEVEADLHHRIAKLDIHELMDNADAPRIALPPDPPAPPSSPEKETPVSESDERKQAAAEPAKQSTGEAQPAVEADQPKDEAESTAGGPADAESRVSKSSTRRTARKKETDNDARRQSAGQQVEPVTPPSQSPRPAWLNYPPKRVGEVWREVIETDEYATLDECYRAADVYLQLATFDHLARLVGMRNYADGERPKMPLDPDFNSHDSRLVTLSNIGIGIDYIRREIAKDEYIETTERSFGPMKKVYTLIEFSPAVDRELRARWDDHRRQERFAVVGGGAASLLALLGVAWGLLRLDTLTKGYYTKRLFIGVPAAIIGGILGLMAWFEVIY